MTENIICEIHKSHIGGVCSEISCNNSPSLLCIKCVVDSNCCVRKYNHKLISLNEFLNKYFSDYKNHSDISKFLASFIKLKTHDLPKIKDFIQTVCNQEMKIYNKEVILDKISRVLDELASISAIKENEKIEIFSKKLKVIDEFKNIIPMLLNQTEYDIPKKCEEIANNSKNTYEELNSYLKEAKALLRSSHNYNLSDTVILAQKISSMPKENLNDLTKEFSTNLNLIVEQISNDLNQHFSNKNPQNLNSDSIIVKKDTKLTKPKIDIKKLALQMNIFKKEKTTNTTTDNLNKKLPNPIDTKKLNKDEKLKNSSKVKKLLNPKNTKKLNEDKKIKK
jgi:hypothetical protein